MTFQADYPGAIVVEARNYGYAGVCADPVNRPRGFVLHTPEEAADDHMTTPYYFASTDREASTHYFVSYHGFVVQCVPEDEGAYGNAVIGKPAPAWQNRPNLNLCSLNVEIEGYAATIGRTLSAPQRKALLGLLRYACEKYGIPKDRRHIIGHYEVANNRSDPGTLDIDALVRDLRAEDEMTPEQEAELKKLREDFNTISGQIFPELKQLRTDVNTLSAQIGNLSGATVADVIADIQRRLKE
jgi:N-acetyl-anhydromuramyl-L-alanine amidase AmpD